MLLLFGWFELWTQYPGSVVPLAMFEPFPNRLWDNSARHWLEVDSRRSLDVHWKSFASFGLCWKWESEVTVVICQDVQCSCLFYWFLDGDCWRGWSLKRSLLHHRTMRLSPCKGVNYRFEPDFHRSPHFPVVYLFQTKFRGKCHFHFLFILSGMQKLLTWQFLVSAQYFCRDMFLIYFRNGETGMGVISDT